jgi:hypothetical protein
VTIIKKRQRINAIAQFLAVAFEMSLLASQLQRALPTGETI